jgi:hypothetical protein
VLFERVCGPQAKPVQYARKIALRLEPVRLRTPYLELYGIFPVQSGVAATAALSFNVLADVFSQALVALIATVQSMQHGCRRTSKRVYLASSSKRVASESLDALITVTVML